MAEKIVLKNYDKLLSEVLVHIGQTQEILVKTVTRKKVEMAWKIGKSIEGHLLKSKQSSRSNYGKHLFAELERGVKINQSTLYKMHSFYKSYPKLPADSDKLNWSHYRILGGVKESEERKRLENLAIEEDWNSSLLQSEVKKSKSVKQSNAEVTKNSKKSALKKLIPIRGQLFSYSLVKLANAHKFCVDCGFNIFKDVGARDVEELKSAGAVDVTKDGKNYELQKSDLHPRKFNTYKAYLDRVVDGDTIRVTVDLGFEILHKEIIRFRGINAAESDTEAGKKAGRALARILRDVGFLVIKTTQVDDYGRFVADVFLSDGKGKMSAQEVANEGIYLNQLLLEKGLAEMWER